MGCNYSFYGFWCPQHIFKQVHLCQRGSRSQHVQAWQSRMDKAHQSMILGSPCCKTWGLNRSDQLESQSIQTWCTQCIHAIWKRFKKSSSKSWKLWSRRPRQSQEFTLNHPVHLRAFQSQCRAEYFRRDDRQGPPNNQAWTRAPDKCMCEANMLRRCCFRSRGNGRKLAWQGTWHEGTAQLCNFFVNVNERIWSWGVLVRWTSKPTYWGDMLEGTRMRTYEGRQNSHSQHAD